MKQWLEKFKTKWQKYQWALLSGLISALICFSLMAAFFCRNYAIGMLKSQFEELEKNLQSVGYDFAYDHLQFYSFSPWQIMRAKNFRIYSLDESDFWQWTAEELDIDVGLWNNESVEVFLGSKQKIQHQNQEWEISLPMSEFLVRLKDGSIKEMSFSAANAEVKHLFSLESLNLQMKQQKIPQVSFKADIKGVHIDDMTGWPLNKQIDHFFLQTALQGNWDKDSLMSEAFYDWIDKGGYLAVHKMILNWKPLIMVANGDIIFNESAEATISLNTASLALLETLDKLNENGFVSNKGVFVAKLLLSKKAVQQKAGDTYKTIIAPLKITKDAVLLENIKIK